MAVYGRHRADTKYGIEIGWADSTRTEVWYGSNQVKRDREFNKYVEKRNVLYVRSIEAAK